MDPLAEKYPAWSPYNYTLNNPVNNTDSSGMCPDDDPNCFDSQVVIERKGYSQFRRFLFKAQAFVHGVGNAILDNATPFNFRSPIGHALYENEPEAYNLGQDVGDSISAVVGTAETVVGVVEAGAGATTTVGSGGTTALVSVPATAQGVALAGHGLSTTLKAIENLIGQNGRVYSEGGKQRKKDAKTDMSGNTRENKQFKDAVRDLNLTKNERQQLHREIGGQGLDYHQIREEAQRIANERRTDRNRRRENNNNQTKE